MFLAKSAGLCDSPLERGGGVCFSSSDETHPSHRSFLSQPLSRAGLLHSNIEFLKTRTIKRLRLIVSLN